LTGKTLRFLHIGKRFCRTIQARSLYPPDKKSSSFQFPENKEVNIISDESVVTSRGSSDMQRCDNEEADTRIVVHVEHALYKGDFPRRDRFVFIRRHLDWFEHGEICPIQHIYSLRTGCG